MEIVLVICLVVLLCFATILAYLVCIYLYIQLYRESKEFLRKNKPKDTL